ncbi:DNA-directed DNA polymerase II small subunit [Candidatus Woesearchaeota archaeon]|nr:DNA-directed DNA polymerase II small subunit [Candidatus Woesearchaeota archaeon]
MNEELINSLLEKGFLVSPEFLESGTAQALLNGFSSVFGGDRAAVINPDMMNGTKNGNGLDINWIEFEKSRADKEKGRDSKIYRTFLDIINYKVDPQKEVSIVLQEQKEERIEVIKPKTTEKLEATAIVVKSYPEKVRKRELQHFVSYFTTRYNSLKKFLQNRTELQNLTSINRLIGKTFKEQVSVIGLVYEKSITKNGNVMLTLEDPTGHINVLINKTRERLWTIAKDICSDEVIGITGVCGGKIIFVNDIIFPDIMLNMEPKSAPQETYAAFISDVHVGSKLFLERDFEKFVSWINGKVGSTQQKEIAKKLKYLFVVGDIVDGVGIYPEQHKELNILDIYAQYDKCAKLFREIRDDVKVIICPGNHDACRLSEPQPALKEVAAPLRDLPNVLSVSNPAYVNVDSTEDFPGFNVLMYHGYSFDYYAYEVNSIREAGGCQRPDLIAKYALQRRHLAPAHSSTLYIPEVDEDALVIDRVPDIFATGHIHKSSIGNYNGISTIAASCWQSKTKFQEKVGHEPDPGKVPIMNLKSREIKMMKF